MNPAAKRIVLVEEANVLELDGIGSILQTTIRLRATTERQRTHACPQPVSCWITGGIAEAEDEVGQVAEDERVAVVRVVLPIERRCGYGTIVQRRGGRGLIGASDGENRRQTER